MKQPLRIVHARTRDPRKTGRPGGQVGATQTATTAEAGDSSGAIASTAFVTGAIAAAAPAYQPAGSYQAADPTLAALAKVDVAADQLVYATGPDSFATTPFTDAGRRLVDDATAKDQRVTLGLEALVKAGDADFDILNTHRVVVLNVNPTAQRTWTLPKASEMNPGQTITLVIGTSFLDYPLVIARRDSDILNNSTSYTISTPRAVVTFVANTAGTWTTDARIKVAGTTANTYAVGNDDRIVGALQAKSNLSDLANLNQSRGNLDVYSTTQTTNAISAAIASAAAGYQPADADLTAIAQLTTTPFGRSLLTAADQTAGRGMLGAEGTASRDVSGGYAGFSKGTWVPVVALGVPGTSTITYATQAGTYSIVGDLVFVDLQLNFTPVIGTGSGDLIVSGLPVAATGAGYMGPVGSMGSTWTWPTGKSAVTLRLSSTTTVVLQANGSGLNNSNFGATNMTSGAAHILRGSIVYKRT